MAPTPQVVQLSNAQVDDLVKKVASSMEAWTKIAVGGVVAKARDGLSAMMSSEHAKSIMGKIDELQSRVDGTERQMVSIFESVVDSCGTKFVEHLEALVERAIAKLQNHTTAIEAAMARKIEEAKATIEKLRSDRIKMDPQTVSEIMTHARSYIFQAVAEGREHMSAYLSAYMGQRVASIVEAAVEKASPPQKSSALQTLAHWCAIFGFLIIAAGATAISYAVMNFKPVELDMKLTSDGLQPSPQTAAAIRDHSLAFSRN